MKKYAGIIMALASAFLFGVTPVFAKLSYAGGSNGITLTFLRGLFAAPVIFAILKWQRVSLLLTRQELKDVLRVGILGPAATTIILYESYNFIPVGIATILHFAYPVVVTLASMLLFKSKVSPLKLVSLLLGCLGVVCFFEMSGGNVALPGILMALGSSVTYTIYMLGVEKTSLGRMHYFKLSFYMSVVALVVSGVFGLITGRLNLNLTPAAWGYSFLVSMMVSVGAITLFQYGITLIGASTTAILSTLEPITSVVMGILVLGEQMSVLKMVGCVLILVAVMVATLAQLRQQKAVATPEPQEGA